MNDIRKNLNKREGQTDLTPNIYILGLQKALDVTLNVNNKGPGSLQVPLNSLSPCADI